MVEEIQSKLFYLGINDRQSDFFEGQWPLPHGISYNSYLLSGEKNILIDGVARSATEEWLQKIEQIIPIQELDYLVVNHLEPDHSGSIPVLRRINPEIQLIGTDKTAEMLKKFYSINSGVKLVKSGQTLQIGDHKLSFYPVPFVHWPESMVTYCPERKLLFSNDIFGSYGSLEGGLFNRETALRHRDSELLRYFSNIIGSLTTPALKALEKLSKLEIKTVAPSHGPLWKEDTEQLFKLYKEWCTMQGRPGITLIYGTMYGYTEQLMEQVARGIASAGLKDFTVIDIARTHPSFALAEAWRRRGLIIGSPTYGNGLFPPAQNLLEMLLNKGLENPVAAFFGCHGWSGGAINKLCKAADKLDWEQPVTPVKFSGEPSSDELKKAFSMGQTVATNRSLIGG